jgi:protease-4
MKDNIKLILAFFGGTVLLVLLVALTFLLFWGGNVLSLGNNVAVIPLQGTIAYGESDIFSGTVVNPQTISDSINEANEDSSIRSIVLEINSGGGSPVASEEIMSAVKNSKKPVVIWISDVGASGAYLVASAGDKIVASPSSTVGSIGVILSLTDLSELYQKIGVNKYSIKAGEYKDIGADYRNLTPAERQMLQEMVNQDYDYFIKLVAENRQLNETYVRSIAEGKVYTGSQAKDLKLIDETGGRDQALKLAAELGNITGSYNVVTITPPESMTDILDVITNKLAYSFGKGIGSFLGQGSFEYSYTKR